eukprot:s4_g36.t1
MSELEEEPLGVSELGFGTAADPVGARELVEMGREKESLEMSELGCADGCGGRGRARALGGVGGNGWGGKPVGMSELGCADGCGRQLRTAWVQGNGVDMDGKEKVGGNERGTAADGVGPREGDERAWLRGRLRMGRAQGNGWKWGEKKPAPPLWHSMVKERNVLLRAADRDYRADEEIFLWSGRFSESELLLRSVSRLWICEWDGAEAAEAGVRSQSKQSGSLPPESVLDDGSESPLFPHGRNDHGGQRRTVHGRILGTPQAKVAEELPEHLHTPPHGYVPRPMASVASAHGFHHPPMPVAQPATPPVTPPVGPAKVGPGHYNPGQPGYHPVYAQSHARSALAACSDAQCVEEEEAMELAQLRTQLLQVKMELGSTESEGLYGKLGACCMMRLEEEVACRFTALVRSYPLVGAVCCASLLVWEAGEEPGTTRPYVEDCSDLGATPKAPPAPTKITKKAVKPDWCAHIPEAQKHYSPESWRIETRQREANLAWRPTLLEMESAENSSATVYGKLLTSAPHWCGYIPWLVQFVVPPCWFGKPAPSTGPLGPDGKPEWCKWVSPSAIEYVPDCKGGMYDKGPVLGAAPSAPATRPNVKPGWCSHVPKENLRYVPDCAADASGSWTSPFHIQGRAFLSASDRPREPWGKLMPFGWCNSPGVAVRMTRVPQPTNFAFHMARPKATPNVQSARLSTRGSFGGYGRAGHEAEAADWLPASCGAATWQATQRCLE